MIRVYDEAGNLDLSGWEERIRKSKRQPKLPGRHQETVRFFNAVKKGSAGGRTTMTLLRERERSDDNDARAFLLSNAAGERIEVARPALRIAQECELSGG